jgi:hypothetical protein
MATVVRPLDRALQGIHCQIAGSEEEEYSWGDHPLTLVGALVEMRNISSVLSAHCYACPARAAGIYLEKTKVK